MVKLSGRALWGTAVAVPPVHVEPLPPIVTVITVVEELTSPAVLTTGASKVAVYAVTKLAVMVPGPEIVAVVLAEVELAITIEPVLELQDEKRCPELALAVIKREPAFSHAVPTLGEVVPAPDGLTAMVT